MPGRCWYAARITSRNGTPGDDDVQLLELIEHCSGAVWIHQQARRGRWHVGESRQGSRWEWPPRGYLVGRQLIATAVLQRSEELIAGTAAPAKQQPRIGVELIGEDVEHRGDVLARVLPIRAAAVGAHEVGNVYP